MKPIPFNYRLAYSFADMVYSTVLNPHENGFSDDVLPDFFGFRSEEFFAQIRKPQKKTLLHIFIFEISRFVCSEDLGMVGLEEDIKTCEMLIESANMQKPEWLNLDEAAEHDLEQIINDACEIITEAAFQLLFSDRSFLFEFNQMVSKYIALLNVGEHSCVVSDGVIKREPYFPVWIKNAVFHRDKGRCQLCFKDLTNLLVPTEARHVDHMVPLKAHGTNDPTNLQLTCETCNTSKGAKVHSKKPLTYPFW